MREKPAMRIPHHSRKEYVHGEAVFGFWRDGSRGLGGHFKADLTGWFAESDKRRRSVTAIGGPAGAGEDGAQRDA